MFSTTSETGVRLGPWGLFRPPVVITDCSNAVVLLWFSVACFGVGFFDGAPPYVCPCCFGSAWVAGWPGVFSLGWACVLFIGCLWFWLFPVLVLGRVVGSGFSGS